ncbi:sodium/potassium/calcium exchanger 3-like [Acropora palmata]|uniref:sodium/potassium/calcium exchanger 3-like n=1 Tax=Acropora palmata TaxID=6131 RepID=UPI003DA15455
MTRKRRFKVQLGFAAFVMIIVIYGWREYDLSDKMTRNALSRTKEISVSVESFTRRNLLAYSTLENKTCTRPSIAEFPADLFNQSQREHGAVVFHFFVVFYLSWAIAIVSDDYFVPVMEIICEKLKLQSDVAGATFMAFGSSAPELFASIIGVFITEGDIGVGTILGSAVFNVLFVIGACGVGAGTVLYLSWWPLVRDNMFYLFSLVILILVLMDGIVTWPEALAMVLSFSIYLLIMFFNPRIEAWLYRITNTSNPEFKSDLDALNGNRKTNNITSSYEKMVGEKNYGIQEKEKKSDGTENNQDAERETDEDKPDGKEQEEKNDKQKEETQPLNGSGSHMSRHYDSIPQQQPDPDVAPKTPFSPPKGLLPRLSWFFGLPINVAFYLTIPDMRKESCQKWVAVSFVICILWVAVASYALVWMVTVIGYTFGLSDAVMGLTLVAFGSSVSDCVASVLIARKGDGNMAVSNTIGSNTFDILLCLGIPWLVKSLWNDHSPIVIHSHGLFLSCFFILGSVVIAFLVLFFTKWVLNRKVGCVFLMAYFIFLGSSIYMELRHADHLPTCTIKV